MFNLTFQRCIFNIVSKVRMSISHYLILILNECIPVTIYEII
jgi:hypothetical protein